jgi:hypothetical protein
MFVLLRNGGTAVAARHLHDSRNSQCVPAEQRQPDSKNHSNKFSNQSGHFCRMANFICFVKNILPTNLKYNLFSTAKLNKRASYTGVDNYGYNNSDEACTTSSICGAAACRVVFGVAASSRSKMISHHVKFY